ncbi:MAG: hypothetical protein ACRD3L_11065 [Terriglobales bacterium]
MMDVFVWSTIILAIWGAVGPLVGVRYGQELAKRWQKQHWISENRKEECRTLLNLIAADYHAHNVAHAGTVSPEDYLRNREATLSLLNALKSSMFIAKEIEELKVRDRWSQLKNDRLMTTEERGEALDKLFAEIRDLVIRANDF